MTFENAYADWITAELNKRTTELDKRLVVTQSFETAYNTLKRNSDSVALVFSGGNASHSEVEGIDQNVMPLLVTVICCEINTVKVLNGLNSLQTEYNAVPMQLTYFDAVVDSDVTVNVKTTFNTPFVFDERDLRTAEATIKATYIQMNASVLYGSNAFISPVAWQLRVNGTAYDIRHIAQYDIASQLGYDEYVAQGSDRVSRNVLSRCNTFHFVLYKTGDISGLAQLLDNELILGDGGLAYCSLTLIANAGTIDAVDIPITTYTLTERYMNNAAAYELLLGR